MRKFVFSHNGFVPKTLHNEDFRLIHFRLLGKTDSEHIFCFLLDCITEELGDQQKDDPVLGTSRFKENNCFS